MLRRCLLAGATFAAVAVPASAILPATAVASVPNTALLNEESVTLDDGLEKEGTPISLEQYAAERAGFSVTVKSGAEWEAMSAAEFAQYQVLIVGDPICGSSALSADESATTWVPVVMTPGNVGNRVVVGTDPEFHYINGEGGASPREAGNPSSAGAEHLVQDGIAFAGGVAGATGIYFTTSCFDISETQEEKEKHEEEGTVSRFRANIASEVQPGREGPDGRDKSDVLEHLTEAHTPHAWGEDTSPPCGGHVQLIATNAAFNTGETKLSDEDIQGWECSVHISFPTFPADWFPLAVATDTSEHPTCGTDPETKGEVCGEAYVLVAGRGIVAEAPNISLTPPTGQSPAGGTHTVTADLHKEGNPVVGQAVAFAVTGQNGGVTGTCTTGAGAPDPECKSDEGGNVQFTYSDVNGAGTDTIVASTTFETVEEEPIDSRRAGRVITTTERASATQEWTPVPAPPQASAPPPASPAGTPAPAAQVLASKATVASTGSAHIASSLACVASRGYTASVKGKGIVSVTYSLDGHKLGTVKHADSHGAFSLRVHVRSGSHRLSMRVTFSSGAHTAPLTLHRTLARCAARRIVPRFTG